MRRILGRAKEQGRADDADTAIIEKRMKTFVEKTMPVIEAYKNEGKVTEIDGMKSVEDVYAEMKKVA
jgi:UMP-CMP kinase